MKQHVFVKHCAPGSNKVLKNYFKHEGHNEGHKDINLGVNWKAFISEVCLPNMFKVGWLYLGLISI